MSHIQRASLVEVLTTDTFEQWRVKTNRLIHAYTTLPPEIEAGTITNFHLGLDAAWNNIGQVYGGTAGKLIDDTKLTASASLTNLNSFADANVSTISLGLKGSVLRTGSVALNKLTIATASKSRILGTGSTSSSVFTEIDVGTGLTISGTTISLAVGAALDNITGGTIQSVKLAAGAALDNITAGSIQFGKLDDTAVIDNINNRLSIVGTTPNSSDPYIGFGGNILNLNSIPLDRLVRTVTTAYLLGSTSTSTDPVKELGLGAGLVVDTTKLNVLFGAGLAVTTAVTNANSPLTTAIGTGTELNKIYVNPAGFIDNTVPLTKLVRSVSTAYLLGSISGATNAVKELGLGTGLSVDTDTLNVNINNLTSSITDNSIAWAKIKWNGTGDTYPWLTGILPASTLGIIPLNKLVRTVSTAYLLGNTSGVNTTSGDNPVSDNPVKELLLGAGLGITTATPNSSLNVLFDTGLAVVTVGDNYKGVTVTTTGTNSTNLNKIYVNPAGFIDNTVPLTKLKRTSTTTAYLLGSTSTSTDPVKELGLGALKINTDNTTIGIISANLEVNSVPLNKLQRTFPFVATSTNSPGAAYILGSTVTTGTFGQNSLVTPAVQQLALRDGLVITAGTSPAPATIGLSAQGVSITKLNSGVTTGGFILGGSASAAVTALTLGSRFEITNVGSVVTLNLRKRNIVVRTMSTLININSIEVPGLSDTHSWNLDNNPRVQTVLVVVLYLDSNNVMQETINHIIHHDTFTNNHQVELEYLRQGGFYGGRSYYFLPGKVLISGIPTAYISTPQFPIISEYLSAMSYTEPSGGTYTRYPLFSLQIPTGSPLLLPQSAANQTLNKLPPGYLTVNTCSYYNTDILFGLRSSITITKGSSVLITLNIQGGSSDNNSTFILYRTSTFIDTTNNKTITSIVECGVGLYATSTIDTVLTTDSFESLANLSGKYIKDNVAKATITYNFRYDDYAGAVAYHSGIMTIRQILLRTTTFEDFIFMSQLPNGALEINAAGTNSTITLTYHLRFISAAGYAVFYVNRPYNDNITSPTGTSSITLEEIPA